MSVKLQKVEGNYRADKLRTILLYEADFNQNNKFLGKLMIIRAKEGGVFVKE